MVKFQLEYVFKASPPVLYSRLSSASGLAEWFADNIIIKGKIFTFVWDNADQKGELIMEKQNELTRFRWLDNPDDTYFEFMITKDDLTGEVSLVITDFAEEDEKDDAIGLWNSQVAKLKHVVGS